MSWDQTLLYRSCRAIIDGVCPPWLARRKVGGVSHARWLTTAIRINFLYMSMTSPSPEITRLATFVVTVYACLWFQCKRDWKVTQAGKIVFDAMKKIYALKKEHAVEYFKLKPVFERGFYWGHSEQLLLSCLGSENREVRARAVRRIIKARSDSRRGEGGRETKVRIFEVPKPVYDAADFESMIDWKSEQISSPPILRKYSNKDLEQFIETPLEIKIPSNTQHVERFIQLMAKNATKAATTKLRNGICKTTIQHRQKRPRLERKSDFEG